MAARDTLNFKRPIAVMYMGVLGYSEQLDEVLSVVRTTMDAAPSGSYLALWDSTNTRKDVVESVEKLVESGGEPYNLRSPDELRRCFEGLELVEPGLVPINHWRPATTDIGGTQPEAIDAYGAVGRKP